ncbi:hypothetical protein [Allorhodopirellula solitaria]|nr:hypothetical protein [Allorhodopirellula solitaria]
MAKKSKPQKPKRRSRVGSPDNNARVRCFSKFTADLESLADWLDDCGMETVAMESTGVALQGNWREEHLFALQQALELYRYYGTKLVELDKKQEQHLSTFEDLSEGEVLPKLQAPMAASNSPAFDMRNHLYRILGMDLTTIDGIGGQTAMTLISLLLRTNSQKSSMGC